MTATSAEHPPRHAEGGRLMQLATYASVAAASLLILVKLGAWVATDSVAILSTLIDSTLDAGASLINLLAVRHALQPADREHRFGHGKAEPLAGLAMSAFIAGSGLFLIIEAAGRFSEPKPVSQGWAGIGVMVFSIAVTFALVRFQKYVISHTESVAISADALHYTGDVMINGSVIISLLVGMFLHIPFIDPIFAIGIAGYLVWNAWNVLQESLHLLMDREFPEEDRERIKQICRGNPQVRNMHDLRTRSAGMQRFIQLHLELDGELPLWKAHAIGDQVEKAILEAFPAAEVIIHHDPAGISENHPQFT